MDKKNTRTLKDAIRNCKCYKRWTGSWLWEQKGQVITVWAWVEGLDQGKERVAVRKGFSEEMFGLRCKNA